MEDADEDDDNGGDLQGGKAGKDRGRGRGKGRGRGRGAGAERAVASTGARKPRKDKPECVTKTCSKCKKNLASSEFNKDQGKCKDCNNKCRSFRKALTTQMGQAWVDQQAASGEATVEKLEKQYNLECKQAEKEKRKSTSV